MTKVQIALVAAIAAAAALAGASPASAHRPSCAFKVNATAPVGHPFHIYPLPHGCVSLALPADVGLPTVVVRQHNQRNRVFTRRFRAPGTNLDHANGSLGMEGRRSVARPSSSWAPAGEMVFLVTWPFVTISGQEVYSAGDRRVFTDIDLSWTLWLSPALRPTWLATREQTG